MLNAGEFVTLELPLVNELTKDMTPVSTAQNSVTADNGEKICAILQGPSNLTHSITSSFSKTAKLSNESSVSHDEWLEHLRANFVEILAEGLDASRRSSILKKVKDDTKLAPRENNAVVHSMNTAIFNTFGRVRPSVKLCT